MAEPRESWKRLADPLLSPSPFPWVEATIQFNFNSSQLNIGSPIPLPRNQLTLILMKRSVILVHRRWNLRPRFTVFGYSNSNLSLNIFIHINRCKPHFRHEHSAEARRQRLLDLFVSTVAGLGPLHRHPRFHLDTFVSWTKRGYFICRPLVVLFLLDCSFAMYVRYLSTDHDHHGHCIDRLASVPGMVGNWCHFKLDTSRICSCSMPFSSRDKYQRMIDRHECVWADIGRGQS